jgi:hypothetical protein
MAAQFAPATTSPSTLASAALMPVVSILLILSVAVPSVWAVVAATFAGVLGLILGITGMADQQRRNPRLALAATVTNGMLSAAAGVLLALVGWLT